MEFDLRSAAEFTEACTHCGLCLESCATYVVSGEESESPRGRISLVQDAIERGRMSASVGRHVESCLGCMACVSSCPEGVRFDQVLLRARADLPHRRRALISDLVSQPAQVRALPAVRRGIGRLMRRGLPLYTAAHGGSRGRVALLAGCGEGASNRGPLSAAIAVLAAEGYEVVVPPGPECCGGLERQRGDLDGASRRARETIAAFASVGAVDHFVTVSAGCGFAMKRFSDLIGNEIAEGFTQRLCDISELLSVTSPRAARGAVVKRVVYHDPCQLAHGQQIRSEARELLTRIPGLQLIEPAEGQELCCGAPGVYAITHSEASRAIGELKARQLLEARPEIVAAPNPTCATQLKHQLRALGSQVPVLHPVELLLRSIEAAG